MCEDSEERNYLLAGYDRHFERGKIRAYGLYGRVLDAGVGRGYSLLEILKLPNVEVVSVDLSDERIQQVENLLMKNKVKHRVKFVRADLTALPFMDEEFDCAVASNTLHHIPNWKKALEELIRVSRNKVIIQEFTNLGKKVMDSIITHEKRKIGHKHTHDGVDTEAVSRILQKHGEVHIHRGVLTDILVLKLRNSPLSLNS